jgi:hypothetical protein
MPPSHSRHEIPSSNRLLQPGTVVVHKRMQEVRNGKDPLSDRMSRCETLVAMKETREQALEALDAPGGFRIFSYTVAAVHDRRFRRS